MQFAPFAHLHVHSDFSLLGGAASVSALLDKAAGLRQPALALTDYGNLFGAVEFYSAAMKRGIKPILGCELYVCDDHQVKSTGGGSRAPRYHQIVLLARTNQGWQNLMKLVSIGYLEGFYYKPRVDKALLRKYADGLIALSSGWDGEVERLLQKGDQKAARRAALEYQDIFGENCFFIELQRHGAAGQENLNRMLIELAHETEIPLVASNNAHFLAREDFHAFEAMLALQQNRTINDDVAGHYTPECHLKSYEDMQELFEDVPEAVENCIHIASRCNVDLQFGNYQLPDFQAPDGMELKQYIRKLAADGLSERWPLIVAGIPDAKREEYEERLSFELDVIEKMGFPGYFLIVSDFIRWAKQHDIPVGPGRGSGAGSLVAYVLGITDLDPLRYGLLFERFLNPERISMPDFDVDFCMDRRGEVIDYVTAKYGSDHVSQIITYGSMKAKAVVRDVGRVLDMPYAKVDEIAKLVPNDLNITLEKALATEPRLQKMLDKDGEVARLFDIATRLEGLHRHAGKHAAGVVIGREPLVETAPLYKDPREDGMVVQWDMKCAEKVGLIKFDFLGLKTLTVLHMACEHVKKQAPDFDLGMIPLDDGATFRLLQRGASGAVFQLESSGMRDLLTRIRPDCFEDIVALVALYRPGPLQSGMVDDFIARKHGKQEVVYAVPQLEPILSETYGVILYQEQVMKIAQVLASYTLGQADMLRRAMGKKNPAEMAQQRKIFMDGSIKNGIHEEKAEYIFDLMEKFAGYGFNKSHSAAYALIAYQTAYLKAHYPLEFMAATLSCDMGNSDKVSALISDCKNMSIAVLPPDINASGWEFLPEQGAVRFGLGAVKGVGEATVREIEAYREKNQEAARFRTLEDMLLKLPVGTMNKRVLEAMLKAGALKEIVENPQYVLDNLSTLVEQTNRKRKEMSARQSALFVVAEPEPEAASEANPWSVGECLLHEREVLGFYLTGHPLEEYLGRISGLGTATLASFGELEDGAEVVVAAGVAGLRVHHAARGPMAFVQLEDLTGNAEMVCFTKLYAEVAEMLAADKPLLIAGSVDKTREEPNLKAESITVIDDILPELVTRATITTSSIAWDEMTIARVKSMMQEKPGKVVLALHVHLPGGSTAELEVPDALGWDESAQELLEARFGPEALHLRCKTWQPVREKFDRVRRSRNGT